MQACSGILSPSPPPFRNPAASNKSFIRIPSYTRLAPSRPMNNHPSVVTHASTMVEQKTSVEFTYLEGNSWLWTVNGVSVLVDPVLVGNLDFGIPWLYDAAKKKLQEFKLEDLSKVDCLLITQSLDDHCHNRTLEPLSEIQPELQVVATPNATSKLSKLFKNVTYLEPGESTSLKAGNGVSLKITASKGPVLGPPWQTPENGYFVEILDANVSIYIEPHCVFDRKTLKGKSADIVVTPVIQQRLPFFTLVSGQEDAVELSKILQPRYVVAMNNGDLDAKGFLSKLLLQVGTIESFKVIDHRYRFMNRSNQLIHLLQELLLKVSPQTQVLEPEPGLPLQLKL